MLLLLIAGEDGCDRVIAGLYGGIGDVGATPLCGLLGMLTFNGVRDSCCAGTRAENAELSIYPDLLPRGSLVGVSAGESKGMVLALVKDAPLRRVCCKGGGGGMCPVCRALMLLLLLVCAA